MNYKEIKADEINHQFDYQGKPVFKQFKAILKFHEPGLAPVEDETGWYHITEDGTPLYTERYMRTFGYYCGRAAVTSKEGCFHIDAQGKAVYNERYAWVGNFQENYCPVRDESGAYFHIDLNGKPLYEAKYDYVGDFKDGIACVRDLNGRCHHIDATGKPINDKQFLDLGVFHKMIAPVQDAQGWFHSDIQGNELYKDRYLAIEPFYNGFAVVTCFDSSKKIINERGEIVKCLSQKKQ